MRGSGDRANLTVAIATLHRPEALARCLDAVLAGSRMPAEIVVVDQSRDDLTQAAVEKRRESGAPIEYTRQPRLGLSASRNAAFTVASHPVVAVTDDDCVPEVDWVERIERAFAPSDSPEALTGRVLPLGPAQPGLYAVSQRGGAEAREYQGRVLPWLVGTGGNFAIKRDWLVVLGGYDERLGAGSPGRAAEDVDMLYRLLRAGALICYEPEAIIYHERQSWARREASRWSYGYGMGSFCGLWLRQGDAYALYMLGRWLSGLCRALGGALRRGQWRQAHLEQVSLRGTLGGLAYGWRVYQHSRPLGMPAR